MDLRRRTAPDLRFLRAPLALAAVLVAVQSLGGADWRAWAYDRAAILDGHEAWRLVTGHLIHHDLTHFAWNLAGLALVAWLFAGAWNARSWATILGVSTAAVDLGFLVLQPQLEWYVGFSGVLHGLMAAGLYAWLQQERDPVTVIVAVLFVAKLAWEQAMGPLPLTARTLDLPVVYAAHGYGAIGGFVAAVLLGRRGRRAVASL